MKDPTPITIGIPFREEGQNVELLLRGLAVALDQLPMSIPREVVICVNGSPAGCVGRIEEHIRRSDLPPHNPRVISSQPGKLEALRAIVAARSLKGFVAFVDSDVVLDPRTLKALHHRLESTPSCMISYCQPVPVFPRVLNPIHRVLRVHYSLRDKLYKRPYFHGRAFALREWFLDTRIASPNRIASTMVSDRLRLSAGPLVDDMIMSWVALDTWGPDSIHEERKANVYFDPPDTLRALYAANLRVAIETKRISFLYPQYVNAKRGTALSVWNHDRLSRYSWRIRLVHRAFRTLESILKRVAKIHVLLVTAGALRVNTLWIQVPGTKGFSDARKNSHLFNSEREGTSICR